ncbi:hypothetical protein GOP47_0015054 [Adiantum capillus-veneris]|uniref:Uncharacterized protein n=1 Tax=Adiantum capillus-veneris TaxID=13818 RepID=A0A9D4UNC3_ADICA|nr:hypothetical protein GOP47_0015054 [Adiantum capillus-veneris]
MSKRSIARAHALSEAFLESPDRKVQQAAFDALQIIGSETEDKRMERKIEEQSGRKRHKRKHGEGDAASTDGHRSSKRRLLTTGVEVLHSWMCEGMLTSLTAVSLPRKLVGRLLVVQRVLWRACHAS